MTEVLRQLGIDRMSVAERIALAQEPLDSVAAEEPRPPLSEAKNRELDRRLAEHAANPADVVPWEEVEAAALNRFDSVEHDSRCNPLRRDCLDEQDYMFGDVGMIYVFFCFECCHPACVHQCY